MFHTVRFVFVCGAVALSHCIPCNYDESIYKNETNMQIKSMSGVTVVSMRHIVPFPCVYIFCVNNRLFDSYNSIGHRLRNYAI